MTYFSKRAEETCLELAALLDEVLVLDLGLLGLSRHLHRHADVKVLRRIVRVARLGGLVLGEGLLDVRDLPPAHRHLWRARLNVALSQRRTVHLAVKKHGRVFRCAAVTLGLQKSESPQRRTGTSAC